MTPNGRSNNSKPRWFPKKSGGFLCSGSAAEWYGLIQAEKANDEEASVVVLCEAAEVSESGYYAWHRRADRPATEREERRTDLSARVCEIFEAAMGRYGYRRIHAVLQRDDWVVSDRTIRVIMGEHGLVCCHPRPWRYCTKADGTPPASDLIRRGCVSLVTSPRSTRGQVRAIWRR